MVAMSPISALAGFPVVASHKIQINGQSYFVGQSGVNAIELAVELLHRRMTFQSLLPLRSEIRNVELESCKAALSHLIEMTSNKDLKLIAIWLRGRCGGYVGTQTVARFAQSEDERMRYVVAKALQNMACWNTLASMAKYDPSDRVRRVAAARPLRKFRDRLNSFAKNLELLPHSSKPKGLVWSSSIDLRNPIRSKSVELIRKLLERIRNLVHR